MERISADFIVASDSIGIGGQNDALVLVDRFSGLIGVHPCNSRSADDAEEGLRHFCGKHAPNIVEVSSDREKGILKASKMLGFVTDPAPPNVKIHNSIAEAAIRTVKGSVSSLLLHAGMQADHWPLAMRYFEFSYNVNTMSRVGLDPPVTCFEAAHGYPYEGYMIPFGALVWFKGSEGKSFEPKGSPALYLGAELIHGMKFKGNHIVWSLEHCLNGIHREKVVRTLAFPLGKWQFPLKSQDTKEERPSIQDLKPPDELDNLVEEEDLEEDEPKVLPMPGGKETKPSETKAKGETIPEKKRNRAVTTLRIAVHGPTPKCEGCKYGTYSHSSACRERFNKLLDHAEPVKRRLEGTTSTESKEPSASARVGGAPDVGENTGAISEDELENNPSYSPSTVEDPGDVGRLEDLDLEDPEYNEKLDRLRKSRALIASGGGVKDLIQNTERGTGAIASIFLEAVEIGGAQEEPLSVRLAKAMTAQVAGGKPSGRPLRKMWFVEFCCSKCSEISKVCEELGIPYIGLSRNVCDLSNPFDLHQVVLWAQERIELGEAFHLWGSLPCTPWCSWQHLNEKILDEEFNEDLQNRREESRELVSNFSGLADLAIESGGSASFEWPRFCTGWVEVEELNDMLTKHNMFATYPCGCGFNLTIKGLKPLKPWRIITTHKRLAIELDSRRCCHPKGFVHDKLEGGNLAYLSGFYNREMAISILGSLFPAEFLKGIPAMPTVPIEEGDHPLSEKWGRISEQLADGKCFQHAQALVHRVLSRKEIEHDPKAVEAIQKEASEVREMQVWDDSSVCELSDLKRWARETRTKIHVAEIMAIGSIKNDELGPSLSQHKGRLVFRGDATRDQFGQPAQFRDLHSQPASMQTISLVLFYGMLANSTVLIADAKKAYLQATLRSDTPTWVVLPKLCWLSGWEKTFRFPTVRLQRALYGHPEAGDYWFEHLNDILTSKMTFDAVENFPSLWFNSTSKVLVAAYVDDIICAGNGAAVGEFWKVLQKHVNVDGVTVPGRYLGRDHAISEVVNGKDAFLSMKDYCVSAVELYLQAVGGDRKLKTAPTPYLNETDLNVSDWDCTGMLSEKSASILMKILWLARLSRPDIAHGVTRLASGITRWSVNHDKMLYRLVSYMNSTVEYGVWCSVRGDSRNMSLHLFTDADLGGDICTMKSHSGIYLVIQSPDGTHFPISWSSRRQQCVAKSTTESEIVALSEGLFNEAIPVQSVLNMVLGFEIPVTLHEDNTACIHIINAGYSAKLKYLSRTQKLSIASLKETIVSLGYNLQYTETIDQLADIFTKCLAKVPFCAALSRLRISGFTSKRLSTEVPD